jgi:hypothetical protein
MFSEATGAAINPSHHSQRSASFLALAGLFTLGCIRAIEPLPKVTGTASPVAVSLAVACVADRSGAGEWDY